MSVIFHDPILIRGTIANLQCSQDSRDLLSGRSDSTFVGATAVATGAAGFGGQAVGLASLMDTDLSETMDYVHFELDGRELAGNLWHFPFKEGDEVEAVVEEYLGKYKIYSARRVRDGLIAIYPHSTCGRIVHFIKSIRYGFYFTTAAVIIFTLMLYFGDFFSIKVPLNVILLMYVAIYAIMLMITMLVAYKFMRFVKAAENIFRAYDWPNPGRIDLYKTSKKYKRHDDPEKYGTRFFRFSNE